MKKNKRKKRRRTHHSTITTSSTGPTWYHDTHAMHMPSNEVRDLHRQIAKFASEAYAVSASVRSVNRGERTHYAIQQNRAVLRAITRMFKYGSTIDWHAALKKLQHAIDALARRAQPRSMFTQFVHSHADDITAFEVAWRMIEDDQRQQLEAGVWWKPGADFTNIKLLKQASKPTLYHKHYLTKSISVADRLLKNV